MLSQLCSFLWYSAIPRETVKIWDAADLWVRSKVTWGTDFMASCWEQQTANLAKWSRFCPLCAGQSRFGAAGTIAQNGVKMGEVIVVQCEETQCKTFFQTIHSSSSGGLSLASHLLNNKTYIFLRWPRNGPYIWYTNIPVQFMQCWVDISTPGLDKQIYLNSTMHCLAEILAWLPEA